MFRPSPAGLPPSHTPALRSTGPIGGSAPGGAASTCRDEYSASFLSTSPNAACGDAVQCVDQSVRKHSSLLRMDCTKSWQSTIAPAISRFVPSLLSPPSHAGRKRTQGHLKCPWGQVYRIPFFPIWAVKRRVGLLDAGMFCCCRCQATTEEDFCQQTKCCTNPLKSPLPFSQVPVDGMNSMRCRSSQLRS